MKKIILPALLVGGLTLFSFTKTSEVGVDATGKKLEQKASGLKYSNAVHSSTDKAYDLKKTQLVISKTNDDAVNMMKGNWLFKSKLTMGIFDATFITWDSPTVPAPAEPVKDIIAKYTRNGNYTEVSTNLYKVNSTVDLAADHESMIRELLEKEYNLSKEDIKKSYSKEGITLTPKAL